LLGESADLLAYGSCRLSDALFDTLLRLVSRRHGVALCGLDGALRWGTG
jgi:hypothetical protein